MTDLTEQWKKGKLPIGWYYIKIADIVFIDFFEGKAWKNKKEKYIDEVISEVPNYVEWRNMVNCACEEHEANNHLIEENAQLKELLKECREVIKNVDTYYGNYDSTNGYLVINKIDEALR